MLLWPIARSTDGLRLGNARDLRAFARWLGQDAALTATTPDNLVRFLISGAAASGTAFLLTARSTTPQPSHQIPDNQIELRAIPSGKPHWSR